MTLKPDSKGLLTGTDGADTITWEATSDWAKVVTVKAKKGNDKITFTGSTYDNKIYGEEGKDNITGGSGADTIYAGAGNDYVRGGEGDDIIYGQSGTNKLYGNEGNDKITGGTGDDTIYAGEGDDIVKGGNGNDTIYGQSGANKLYGNDGDDKITGGTGNDYIYGGNGNDTIYGQAGTNRLYGNDGDDTITGGTGTDYIYGGEGNDILKGGAGKDRIYGEYGTNKLYGGDGDDIIQGGTGIDYIYGGEGNDTLNGGTGDDQIFGESGKNIINGEDGNDTITGGTGVDTIHSGNGNDIVRGGDSNDTIYGDAGTNKLYGDAGNDTITGGTGKDYIYGGTGNDTIKGGDGDDFIYGEHGKNKLYGQAGNDRIYGGDGIDYITGGAGNDIINAGLGDNRIYFGANEGKDSIVSGGGHDTLVFSGSIDFTTVSATYDAVDLKLSAMGTTANLRNYVSMDFPHSAESIQLGDTTYTIDFDRTGDSMYGTDGNDFMIARAMDNQSVYGGAGNDIIFAADGNTSSYYQVHTGKGDDIVYANALCATYYLNEGGNNTIIMGSKRYDYSNGRDVYLGNGNDTVYLATTPPYYNADRIMITSEYVSDGGNDTIYWNSSHEGYQREMLSFDNIKYTYYEMAFTKASDCDDLILRYGDGGYNTVTFKDFYKAGNEDFGEGIAIEAVNSGGWITLNEAIADKGGVKVDFDGLMGTSGNDYIVGTDATETIAGRPGNDFIDPKGGDDNINLGAGDDILWAGRGNKKISVISGDNIINLGGGDNTVNLGIGSDLINSGSGSNIIRFEAGDEGCDTYNYAGGSDILLFRGDSLSDLTFFSDSVGGYKDIQTGAGISVTINNLDSLFTGVTVRDKNSKTSNLFNLNTVTGNIEKVENQMLKTGAGNDRIEAGYGDDVLNPGTGINAITLADNADIGNNDVYTYTDGATDTFTLWTSDFDNFKLEKSGNDLVVAYRGDDLNDTLTISDYYDNTSMSGNIHFVVDSVDKTLATLIDEKGIIEPIIGTNGPDDIDVHNYEYGVRIDALAGNDTIVGSNYNDYIVGGPDSDKMMGTGGNDIYFIAEADWGSGQDIIDDTSASSNDTLRIETGADSIYPFFDVNLGMGMDGNNAVYKTGNDLYLNSDSAFTPEDAKTYTGVCIRDQFNGSEIENIQIMKNGSWVDWKGEKLIGAIGQRVANWLKANDFGSTETVLSSGSAEQKAALIALYKPVYSSEYITEGTAGDDLIVGTKEEEGNQYLYGYAGNDVLIASDDYVNTYIYTGDGNNVVYASESGYTYVNCGNDDDIVYGADGYRVDATFTSGGNNIIYLGERHPDQGNRVTLGPGDDTVYMSPGDLYRYNAGIFTIDNYETTGGGHDTFYWRGSFRDGQHEMFQFSDLDDEDLFFTKADESDDLVLRYGNDSDVTFVDYFQEGKEDFGEAICYSTDDIIGWDYFEDVVPERLMKFVSGSGIINGTEATEYIKGSAGNDTITSNGGDDALNGGAGNDIYSIEMGNALTNFNDTTVFDSAGNDTIMVSDVSHELLHVIFNIENGAESLKGEGEYLILDEVNLANLWHGEDYTGIAVKTDDIASIEKIYSEDGYWLSSSQLNELFSAVSGWLTAKDKTSVSDVIEAGGDDAQTLLAVFADNTNWQEPLIL